MKESRKNNSKEKNEREEKLLFVTNFGLEKLLPDRNAFSGNRELFEYLQNKPTIPRMIEKGEKGRERGIALFSLF